MTKLLRTDTVKRLYSLDALRGFDMFWITGGSVVIRLLAEVPGLGFFEGQHQHAVWAGFQFWDLIFPLFMFVSGVAIPFAIKYKLEKGVPRSQLLLKAFKRMLILVFLGILYNGGFKDGFADARYASVLGEIGIAYFFAAVIVIYFKSFRARIIWVAGILIGFSMIQLLIPVPGYGAGILTPEGCINTYINNLLLPGRFWRIYEPAGILCCISGTGITLMGTIAGNILRRHDTSDWQKISYMAITGVGLIILALIIHPYYPIVKNIWTSTYNLYAGGFSFLLMAFFYMVIDHWGYRKWAFYFRVIGMNSIFIYVFVNIVNVNQISQLFGGWMFSEIGDSAWIGLGILELALVWLLLYFMYLKKIFIRV